MFQMYQFELNKKLTDKEISVFTYKFLQYISVHKIQIDPVDKKMVTVYFLKSGKLDDLKEQINTFLNKWEKETDIHNKKSQISMTGPNVENLCSCVKPTNTENVTSELLEKRWLTLLKGQDVGYTNEIHNLLDFFDRKFIEFFKNEIPEYEERFFSPMINIEYLEKMNYFNNSANHMFLAAHLSNDIQATNDFIKSVEENNNKFPEDANTFIEKPNFVLQTAPCFKIYFSLENQKLNGNKVFTIIGDSYRNEGKRTFLLERLNQFTMREFVFVGTPDFVIDYRDKSLELMVKWMEYLGIKGHCELANDPFFLSDDDKEKYTIPENVKYEVRAEIPYKKETISIASYDTHGNYFSEIFNFQFNNNDPVWSGCIGLGLERCVWSFLQQYGLEKEKWPKNVREELCQLT